jgi:predicted transcriptional regulator
LVHDGAFPLEKQPKPQKMPDQISAKPSRERIEDAIAEQEDLLQPGDSLQFVSDKMVALDTNILPVSEGGRLIGLADEPNPGLDASSHGHDPKTTRISETMNRDIVFCYEDDDCAVALRKMEERKLSHLPVVDREMRIVALVARNDLSARIGKAEADHTAAGTVASPVALNTIRLSRSADSSQL